MDSSVEDIPGTDRVRRLTPPEINREIDRRTTANIHHYSHAGQDGITQRIAALDREWDVGRMLDAVAGTAALAIAGLALGMAGNRKWLLLPGLLLPLLVRQTMRGRSLPVRFLRRLGVRTRNEINRERQALMRVPEDMAGLPLCGRS